MNLAIVCASGIGDALIFHSVSNSFHLNGWQATTFSDHIAGFGKWLSPKSSCAPQPTSESISGYDAIFLQHDNSPKAYAIQKQQTIPVFTFYGAHCPLKHGPFSSDRDYVCDRQKTMVENVDLACLKFFGWKTNGNGFTPPHGLIHRRCKRRIAIHPTASSIAKQWPREKFLIVADHLQKIGCEPVFTVSPKEQPQWGGPMFHTLEDLASFIYESDGFLGNDSGTGHLASLLNLPHLIIGGDGLQMPLWRTGWLPGYCLQPPSWLMRLKPLRKQWNKLISTRSVIKKFKNNALRN